MTSDRHDFMSRRPALGEPRGRRFAQAVARAMRQPSLVAPRAKRVAKSHGRKCARFAVGDKLQFCYFGTMYEYDIGFTTPASIKCLTGPRLQHFQASAL